MDKLIFNATRDAYSTNDLRTMSVRELKAFLEDFDDDTFIYLSFDRGYTYGGLSEYKFELEYGEDY